MSSTKRVGNPQHFKEHSIEEEVHCPTFLSLWPSRNRFQVQVNLPAGCESESASKPDWIKTTDGNTHKGIFLSALLK